MSTATINAKDLAKEPPRSPRVRIEGYAILARMADKGRADLNGTVGEYHFNCPLDQMLFSFKGVTADEVRPLLESGAGDEEIAQWFDAHGAPKSETEIKIWSDSMEAAKPYDDPEHRDWFVEQCEPLGLDPQKTTLFEYLEADDRATFKKK